VRVGSPGHGPADLDVHACGKGKRLMLVLATLPLAFNTLIATTLVLPVFHQEVRKIGANDFSIAPLTLPTPERFKSKQELVAFTKANSSYGFGRPPEVEEFTINGIKIHVMEYRKHLLNAYFVYRDFDGVLVRLLETNFFAERLFFTAGKNELVIRKGLNSPEEDVITIRNFDNAIRLYVNYPVNTK